MVQLRYDLPRERSEPCVCGAVPLPVWLVVVVLALTRQLINARKPNREDGGIRSMINIATFALTGLPEMVWDIGTKIAAAGYWCWSLSPYRTALLFLNLRLSSIRLRSIFRCSRQPVSAAIRWRPCYPRINLLSFDHKSLPFVKPFQTVSTIGTGLVTDLHTARW
jgi:hypothetical protein